jgi:lipopolysaccharide transport system permease protein
MGKPSHCPARRGRAQLLFACDVPTSEPSPAGATRDHLMPLPSSAVDLVGAAPDPIRARAAVQPDATADPDPLRVIVPATGWRELRVDELWAARELIGFLVWRDIKLRYKQTVLGAAWAIIQPGLTMVVFTLFFGKLASVPSDGVPYPVFSFAALVPWTLFSFGLTQATQSVVGSQHLITKVYFPRLAIPLAAVLAGLPDFLIACGVLILMMIGYAIAPGIHLLWLPAYTALAFATALGAGLWLAALNVAYRDVRYAVPFLTQVWLFATPIAYPGSLLREPWHTLYGLNPMAGVVDGFRWALLGTPPVPSGMMLVSVSATMLMLAGGVLYFQRMERTFADIV